MIRDGRTGVIHVNSNGGADGTVPLGSVGQSGNGSDKSRQEIDKYINLKTAWIKLWGRAHRDPASPENPAIAHNCRRPAARGAQMWTGVQGLMAKYDLIGDVRGGHGLMTAIELVSDRATKVPIDKATAAKIHQATYAAGTMVRVSGNTIILSPPLVLTKADTDTILASLDAGLAAV